jgi:hypothetical protein
MSWDSFSDSELGSTDNSQLSTRFKDLPDQKKPENSATRESKDMFSIELESEEEEERSQSPRVLSMVSQLPKVSHNWNQTDPTEPSLRTESEEDAKT